MRVTILPLAIILTKAHIGPRSVWWPRGVLWPQYCLLGVSYFYYPTIPMLVCFFLFGLCSDEPEVFLPKYSQTAILYAAYFRRVANSYFCHIYWQERSIASEILSAQNTSPSSLLVGNKGTIIFHNRFEAKLLVLSSSCLNMQFRI